MSAAGLDGLICAKPANVLMLSGYCPVTGMAVAVATGRGQVVLVVPEDEHELALGGAAEEVRTFEPATLDHLGETIDALRPGLQGGIATLCLGHARVGYESREITVPAPYVASHDYGDALVHLLREVAPAATLVAAGEMLSELRSVKSPREIERIQLACHVAAAALGNAPRVIMEGASEAAVAAALRESLSAPPRSLLDLDQHRADGFVFCMSGPNSYEAFAAFQRSRGRAVRHGDLVLIHCNSYVDGLWTDITRTFVLGEPDDRQRRMYDAVFAAREAALDVIRPGVRAADVDLAARTVIQRCGFGEAFKHATGHGVGFAAIDHNAPPRIHPKSDATLKEGMVFNVEPAIYIEGYGGMRHCDMVAVTRDGHRLLTPFLSRLDELTL
jgi:Xaa-Pro aminopeptidase